MASTTIDSPRPNDTTNVQYSNFEKPSVTEITTGVNALMLTLNFLAEKKAMGEVNEEACYMVRKSAEQICRLGLNQGGINSGADDEGNFMIVWNTANHHLEIEFFQDLSVSFYYYCDADKTHKQSEVVFEEPWPDWLLQVSKFFI